MLTTFQLGDHVRWNSEAGRVTGVIIKKITADTNFKGYTHHASREAPQYLINDPQRHCAAADPCAGKKICNWIKRKNKR